MWTEKALEMRHKEVKAFKQTIVNTFAEQCSLGWYTVRNHLADRKEVKKKTFGTCNVFDSSKYKRFSLYIKHTCKRNLQKGTYGLQKR